MPRSCATGSTDKLFDADEYILNLEQHIAEILFVVGLQPANAESYEINEIINGLRETFSLKESQIGKNQAHQFIQGNYAFLVQKLRNAWFNLQIAKYGKTL
jgi:hypothetical protein